MPDTALLPLPVTVLSGYLGAGKTTLVNHLLRTANGLRLAVLVNDFGDLAIDADLIRAQDEEVISIAGGCVCCSYGNDLSLALLKLHSLAQRPDHVLVEASGVAIPSAITASLGFTPGFTANGIITLVDSETVLKNSRHKYMADTVLKQIRDADILLLNKADLVSGAKLRETQAWLAGLAPLAALTVTDRSRIPLSLVLGIESAARADEPADHEPADHDPADHATPNHDRAHHDRARLDMMSLRTGQNCRLAELAHGLANNKLGIIRAKGFLKNPDGQTVLLQQTGNRYTLTPAQRRPRPEDPAVLGIVCLGFKENGGHEDGLKKTEIQKLFDACLLP